MHVNLDQATELVRQTLMLALIVSAPMLVIGLVVGIIVSLLQAVTQIQEQTLTFVPKIVAMVAAAILLMPWIGQRLMEYAATMFRHGSLIAVMSRSARVLKHRTSAVAVASCMLDAAAPIRAGLRAGRLPPGRDDAVRAAVRQRQDPQAGAGDAGADAGAGHDAGASSRRRSAGHALGPGRSASAAKWRSGWRWEWS